MPEIAQQYLGQTSKGRARRSAATDSAFAFVFAISMQIPNWPQIFYYIYDFPMRDRAVYEALIVNFNLPTDYIYKFSPLMYFTREWTWNTILSVSHRVLGLPIEFIFAVISIFVMWRLAYAIISKCGWIYSVFLINPLIIDFAFSQLRLALAISLVSFFWSGTKPKYITIIMYIFCTSIHTAIAAFAIMHLAAHLFKKTDIRNLSYLLLTGFAVSIALGPLREPILSLIGDRRAEYPDMSSTVIYLSLWIVVWSALIIDWRRSMQSIDSRYAIVILSLVATNVFHDGYSTRFIAAAFPSLIIAMSRWMPKSTNMLLLAFVIYAAIQWLYWLRLA